MQATTSSNLAAPGAMTRQATITPLGARSALVAAGMHRSTLFRYGAAVAAVFAAAACAWLWRGLDPGSLFLLFFAAVVIGAIHGGQGPALLATLLSTILAGIWMTMRGTDWGIAPLDPPRVAALLMLAVAVGWLNARRRAAQEDLYLARKRIDQRVVERTAWLAREEQELMERQLRLRELAEQLSRSEERERRRLAGRLHDDIGQLLALARIELGLLCHDAELAPAVEEAIGRTNGLLEQAITHSRSLTFELSPSILYEGGFEAAVVWLCDQVRQEHGLEIRIVKEGWSDVLGDALRGFLFQAVRELLVNVAKHARAKYLRIFLGEDEGWLSVAVEDDGVGIERAGLAAAPRQAAGFGLFSIRERIGRYGGRVMVNSAPGRGTCIRLEVPSRARAASAARGIALREEGANGH